MQSQEDRENIGFKFKRIISHIIQGLAKSNLGGKDAHRVLRDIQLAAVSHADQYVTRDKSIADQQTEESLFDVLGPGSKLFNNMDSQLGLNPGGRDKSGLSDDGYQPGSHHRLDPVRCIKHSYREELEKLRAALPTTGQIIAKTADQRFIHPDSSEGEGVLKPAGGSGARDTSKHG